MVLWTWISRFPMTEVPKGRLRISD